MNEPKEEKKYFGMDAKTCMKAMLEALTGKPVEIVETKGEIVEGEPIEDEIIETSPKIDLVPGTHRPL